jgi:hypothetical protein
MHRATVPDCLFADPQSRVADTFEQRFEAGAALAQRTLAQILAVVAQKIERDEGDRHIVHLDALQVLEAHRIAALVERNDFAVDDDRTIEPARPGFERRNRGGE